MLDWIFGSSQKQKKQEKKKEEKKQFQLSEDQKWVYDFIRQYLTSPIWRNPILDFIEQNCIVFQDSEQNKFEYTKVYQEFQGLAALLLESMIEQTGITEHTLEKCIYKGLKSEKDRKIFQQILLCDNFLAFKKIMITKNKELQIEALKKIQIEQPGLKGTDQVIQIDTKELQRLQIQKAIAMSMAMQEKARAQQERQFEEALRLSQKSHQEEKKKVEEEKQQKSPQKQSALGSLPPLVIGTRKQFKPMDDLKKDQQNLRKEIEQMKKNQAEQSKESVQERKKRLMEQRELIKKKKQQQRQTELNNFVQNKQQSAISEKTDLKVSQEQLTRRRNLMKKLKQQLKQ